MGTERGRFIVFEGGEGSGKTTASLAVVRSLEAGGLSVLHTREPGGTPAGELVRGLLHQPLTPWAELFAFLAARAQLVATVIRPALEAGQTVLCDRFAPSTFAYQVHARGLDPVIVRTANNAATGGLEADLVVYLDIAPEKGLARKHGEPEAIRTGLEDLDFHRASARATCSRPLLGQQLDRYRCRTATRTRRRTRPGCGPRHPPRPLTTRG